MIFWIASYPKSGNTWLRTLISSYYYSKDGIFNHDLIKNIGQFPEKDYFKDFPLDTKNVVGTTKYWIKAQEKINYDKNGKEDKKPTKKAEPKKTPVKKAKSKPIVKKTKKVSKK